MKALAVLSVLLLAAPVLGAGRSRQPKLVQGKWVMPGDSFPATNLADIGSLRFYKCELSDLGTPCTVVAGTFTSRLPRHDFHFKVSFSFYRLSGTGVEAVGIATTTIKQPAPNRAIRFTALGPDWHMDRLNGRHRYCGYLLSVTAKPASHVRPLADK